LHLNAPSNALPILPPEILCIDHAAGCVHEPLHEHGNLALEELRLDGMRRARVDEMCDGDERIRRRTGEDAKERHVGRGGIDGLGLVVAMNIYVGQLQLRS
jgi:hypothetical protein